MCWPSDSLMLVVHMFSSPICRVRVAKPLDEAVRRGGPLELELELVDRSPEACRAHSVELALYHDEYLASYCCG